MSGKEVLKKNKNFYIGVMGTVLEGLFPASAMDSRNQVCAQVVAVRFACTELYSDFPLGCGPQRLVDFYKALRRDILCHVHFRETGFSRNFRLGYRFTLFR